ncbi:hypothetical protein PJP14_29925, partial [Mycobacterium kansasii]
KLSSKNLVRGLPKIKKEEKVVCRECLKGKQIKVGHKKTTTIATTKPLDLLHMDLVGPTKVESHGKKRYFLVVVDDYTRL